MIRFLKAKLEIVECNKLELDNTLKYYDKKYEEKVTDVDDIRWRQTKAKVILKSTQEYIDNKNKCQNIKLFTAEKEEVCYATEGAKIQIGNAFLRKNSDDNLDRIEELMTEIKEIKDVCRQLEK